MKLAVLFTERYLPHIRRTLKPRTVAEYERLAEKLILPALGERDIDTLTLDDAEALHTSVPGKVQANRTLALLSGMLSYAVRRRLTGESNPCRGIARNREKARGFFYTPRQCKTIIAAALKFPDVRGAYIALELLTGCRPGELRDALASQRFDVVMRKPDGTVEERAVISTVDGKTGGRPIFLSPRACEILDRVEPDAEGRYFPVYMDLRRAWERIVLDANVPRARLYDLRHSFASTALAAGESLAVIGQLMGHRNYQTTLRYVHLAKDSALDAVARTSRLMEQQ
jgi:integrase